MATLPGLLDRSRDLELEGQSRHPWYRRAVLAAMAGFCLLALLNVFGQHSQSFYSQGSTASLKLRVPSRLRSGDIFEARFEIRASDRLAKPTIVLAPDWLQGVTLNSLEPAPLDESSNGGLLRLTLPPIRAGGEATLWTQWQVNPTGFGDRDTSVTLLNGTRQLAHIQRTPTVIP
jgi:hypothetical protein